VGDGFSWDSEISARSLPLAPMGLNPTIPCAVLGEKMGEFVSEGAIDFGIGNSLGCPQSRVQVDSLFLEPCAPSRRTHPAVPTNGNGSYEFVFADGSQQVARGFCQAAVGFGAHREWADLQLG